MISAFYIKRNINRLLIFHVKHEMNDYKRSDAYGVSLAPLISNQTIRTPGTHRTYGECLNL